MCLDLAEQWAGGDVKVLIAGDSFAAPWSENASYLGWTELLSKEFDVTNVAQAGVGEYKIFKQLESANTFDTVIVSHTSYSRVHTNNSLHNTALHQHCDLIYQDVVSKNDLFDSKRRSARLWFEHHYDDEYQKDIYRLLRSRINQLLTDKNYISISHLEVAKSFIIEDQHIDFSEFWNNNRGSVNHYTEQGNKTVFKILKERLCS